MNMQQLLDEQASLRNQIAAYVAGIEILAAEELDHSAKSKELASLRGRLSAITRKINSMPETTEAPITEPVAAVSVVDAQIAEYKKLFEYEEESVTECEGTFTDPKGLSKDEMAALGFEEAVPTNLYDAVTVGTYKMLRDAWTAFQTEDPEMLGYKAAFLEVFLKKHVGYQMPAADWEERYGLITRQVVGGTWVYKGWQQQPSTSLLWGIGANGKPSSRGNTDPSGICIKIDGFNARLIMRMQSSFNNGTSIHTLMGWTATNRSVVIPATWLTPAAVHAVVHGLRWCRAAASYKDSSTYDENRLYKTTGLDILASGTWLMKLWTIAQYKTEFKGFMENRINGGQLCYDVAYFYGKKGNGVRPYLEILEKPLHTLEMNPERKVFHLYPNKEESVLSGGYIKGGPSSIYYALKEDGKRYTNQIKDGKANGKKVTARTVKLILGGRTVAPVGKKPIFIINEVPEQLKSLFVLGNFLISELEFARLGCFRALTSAGYIKGCSLPWDMSNLPHGLAKNGIVCTKSAFKAAGNGVLDGMDVPYHDQIGMSKAQLEAALFDRDMTTIYLKLPDGQYHPITGWIVHDEVYATNLYATYGIRSNKEDDNSEESSSDQQEINGLYMNVQRGLIIAPDTFDVIQARDEALRSKKYHRKPAKVQIKATDFMAVRMSYGEEMARALIRAAVKQHVGIKDPARVVSQDVFLNGIKDSAQCTMDALCKMAAKVWTSQDGAPIEVQGGSFNQNERYDFDNSKWNILVNGDKDIGWPGLDQERGLRVYHQEGTALYQFYLPPAAVFAKHTSTEKIMGLDGKEIVNRYLGDAWTLVISLIKAAYSAGGTKTTPTNWRIKYLSHMLHVNKLIMTDVMSKINVRGRFYTILPRWWSGDVDTITCTDSIWKGKDRVLYMKNPTLFFNPVVDVKINDRLPRGWLNLKRIPALLSALTDVLFASTDFMINKGDDADGDQGAVMDLGEILDLYTGEIAPHAVWNAAYRAGELDMDMSISPYVWMNDDDIHDGVVGAAIAKSNVGKMTANMFNVIFYIERYAKLNPKAHAHTLRMIKEAYATGVQDEAVRQIKQENTAISFFDEAALYSHADQEPDAAASVIAEAIIKRINGVLGGLTDVDPILIKDVVYFMVCQQRKDGPYRTGTITERKIAAHVNGIPKSVLKNNRIGCLFTRGYWDNVIKAAPQFLDLNDAHAQENYAQYIMMSTEEQKEWRYNNPVGYRRAIKAGWASSYMNNADVAANLVNYNRWLTVQGFDLNGADETVMGYMLIALKDAIVSSKTVPTPDADQE